jgi:hypothetical protein
MIIVETVTINGKEYMHTYSDEGRYVVRDGVEYGEAIDPIGSMRAYYEGDVMPTDDGDEATEQDYLNALQELGVNTDEA